MNKNDVSETPIKKLTEYKSILTPWVNSHEYEKYGSYGIFEPNNGGDNTKDAEKFNNIEKRARTQIDIITGGDIMKFHMGTIADEYEQPNFIKHLTKTPTTCSEFGIENYPYLNINGILQTNPCYKVDGVHTPDLTAYLPEFTQMQLKLATIEMIEAYNSGWKPVAEQMKTFNMSSGNNVGSSQSAFQYTDSFEMLPKRAQIFIRRMQLSVLIEKPEFKVFVAPGKYITFEEYDLAFRITANVKLMRNYDEGLVTQADWNEYMFSKVDEIFNDYATQTDLSALEQKVDLLYKSDGTIILLPITGDMKAKDIHMPNAEGTVNVELESYLITANEDFKTKFVLKPDTGKFDIVQNPKSTFKPKIVMGFIFDFTSVGKGLIKNKEEMETHWKLKNDDGDVLDFDGNIIILAKQYKQNKDDKTYVLHKEFTLHNQTYTDCYWEIHYYDDGTAIIKDENIKDIKLEISTIDTIGVHYTTESFINDAINTKIDNFDEGEAKFSLVEKIIDNEAKSNDKFTDIQTEISPLQDWYEDNRIQSQNDGTPLSLALIPNSTKQGGSGAMFLFDPYGNGSIYNNGDNINMYVDYSKLNTRGTTGDYTPYAAKNLTTLNELINNGSLSEEYVKFNELPQKILPLIYNFYDDQTQVAKMDNTHTFSIVATPTQAKTNHSIYYGTMFEVAKQTEDKVLKIEPNIDQSGMTYAEKLAWVNAHMIKHSTTSQALHMLIDVETQEVLFSGIQPLAEWQNPNNMFLHGNSNINGVILNMTAEHSEKFAGRKCVIATLFNGLNINIKTGSFKADIFTNILDTTITGKDSDNDPVVRPADGSKTKIKNLVNKNTQYFIYTKDSITESTFTATDGASGNLTIPFLTNKKLQGNNYWKLSASTLEVKMPYINNWNHRFENIGYGAGEKEGQTFLNINNANGTGSTYDTKIEEDRIVLGNGTILNSETGSRTTQTTLFEGELKCDTSKEWHENIYGYLHYDQIIIKLHAYYNDRPIYYESILNDIKIDAPGYTTRGSGILSEKIEAYHSSQYTVLFGWELNQEEERLYINTHFELRDDTLYAKIIGIKW